MKIHLKQIAAEGLHLEGDETCPIPELEKDGIRCIGPLHYNLDLGVSNGALWANGSLTQPVELSCVSCLEKFVHEIKVPAFAIHMELHGPETVDLSPLIREDLLLNLPAYPHCDRESDRKCKASIPQPGEAESKRKPDWSALDKLEIKK
jgi:uncharacterized metal-binding protein YceD (DUF177 family)